MSEPGTYGWYYVPNVLLFSPIFVVITFFFCFQLTFSKCLRWRAVIRFFFTASLSFVKPATAANGPLS